VPLVETGVDGIYVCEGRRILLEQERAVEGRHGRLLCFVLFGKGCRSVPFVHVGLEGVYLCKGCQGEVLQPCEVEGRCTRMLLEGVQS